MHTESHTVWEECSRYGFLLLVWNRLIRQPITVEQFTTPWRRSRGDPDPSTTAGRNQDRGSRSHER